MIIKVKSLINESYEYEYDENKTVSSFLEFFKEKNNKDISKIVYKGRLVDFNKNFKDINYNSDNFLIIIYNNSINYNNSNNSNSNNNINNNSNYEEDEIRKILEKEINKEKLYNIIIDLIKKDDDVNNKYFNKNIKTDSNYNNLAEEYKTKLKDNNIINDLLKVNEKNNNINEFLEKFELDENELKHINSLVELGYKEDDSKNIYSIKNKNINLSLKILLNK